MSCQQSEQNNTLFELMSPKQTGIDFVNTVANTPDFNIFSYRNFYNGGGVSLGDIDQDGLVDVYMTSNMGENKLYRNLGDFQFEDITEQAGVAGTKGWSTGVVMVDINNDGLLDIYVCNAGYVAGDDQENELFINNGDATFTEAAADFQLNENGYTTHAAFFDYDLDGDLDVYLLNNSFIPVNTLNYSNRRDLEAKDWKVKDFLKGGGDKLLRNDNNTFTDVSKEAGIYGSLIGFGLGITVGDVNGDLYPDMYVSNDFYERDYLYINQGDGTFTEEIKDYMQHISLSSMGADMADLNNDAYPEIFVTEMLPESDYRRKTTSLFENYSIYQQKLNRDFYHQFMQNTLQVNNGDGTFSETAQYSGVAASDWSWGALMFDADNDGYRDIYVCNGVYQDVTDQDFMDFFANDVMQKMALSGEKEEMDKMIEEMPSNPQLNKMFRNADGLQFEDKGIDWGFIEASFSHGAAYGDLDNDGDLDLVVNNLNQQAFVYQNHNEKLHEHHYLQIQLAGPAQNRFAVGAKAMVYAADQVFNFEMIPSRGFQSSIDYKMTFGLGDFTTVDSLVVLWPDQMRSILYQPPVDTFLQVDYQQIDKTPINENLLQNQAKNPLLEQVTSSFAEHKEDPFIDFFQEGLTIKMVSREGPVAAIGDVNGDGTEDVFIGEATNGIPKLYLQKNGKFEVFNATQFESSGFFEDTAAEFFDVDGDNDLDLFVGSGGNHRPAGDRFLSDRIYLNDGAGNFTWNRRAIQPNGFNTAFVIPFDFDEDGDLDLIVGSRSVPGQYGRSPQSFLYESDGKGQFRDITASKAKDFAYAGMLTDGTLIDLDQDGQQELVVVGEWMAPQAFSITKEGLKSTSIGLDDYAGWWYAVEATDINNDGQSDLVLGNRGENFYFSGSIEAPAKLWLNDFDNNRTVEKIITQQIDGRDIPVTLKKELTGQINSLKKQNLKHSDYATKSIQDLFTPEVIAATDVKKGTYFQSAVAINNSGQFSLTALPEAVQWSCICAIYCTDLNGDDQVDLVLGGNYDGLLPQFGKLDASYGHVLMNSGSGGFNRLDNRSLDWKITGDLKQLLPIDVNGEPHLLSLINNQAPQLFKLISEEVQ